MNEKNRRVQEDEIDLLELGLVLLNRWKLLLVAILIGALLGGGLSYFKKDTFKSDSMIFVLSKNNSITSMADLQIGSTISSDFVAIAKSKPVLDTTIQKVEDKDGIRLTREEISDMLSVENMTDTRIIKFSVITEDPQLSCDICNAVAETMVSQIASIMKSDEPTVVEKAEVAYMPVDKGLKKLSLMGGMLALILASMFIIIPYLMDDRIVDDEDVEKYLETSVLGVIPFDKALDYHVGQKPGTSKKERKGKKRRR